MRSSAGKHLILLGFLLILTVVIHRENIYSAKHHRAAPVNRVVVASVGGMEWVISGIQGIFLGISRPLSHARKLDRDNRRMHEEIERLKAQVVRLHELESENQRLRQLLNLDVHSSYPTIASEIIDRDHSNWFDYITLDRGKHHGVQAQSIVVTDAGVVGFISIPDDYTSKAKLLSNGVGGGVGALIQRTRQPGLIQGSNSPLLTLRFLPKDVDIKKGDAIVTSGLGKVFPPGLLIGKVVRISKDPDTGSNIADIKPAVDPARVEQVMIISTGVTP